MRMQRCRVNGMNIIITHDPKVEGPKCPVHAILNLSLERNHVVTGETKVQTERRRSLTYRARGHINSCNLYYTGVCIEDPSDAYVAMYQNLLDDEVAGIIAGWDYSKAPYASPIILSKKELSTEEAEGKLLNARPKFFGAATDSALERGTSK